MLLLAPAVGTAYAGTPREGPRDAELVASFLATWRDLARDPVYMEARLRGEAPPPAAFAALPEEEQRMLARALAREVFADDADTLSLALLTALLFDAGELQASIPRLGSPPREVPRAAYDPLPPPRTNPRLEPIHAQPAPGARELRHAPSGLMAALERALVREGDRLDLEDDTFPLRARLSPRGAQEEADVPRGRAYAAPAVLPPATVRLPELPDLPLPRFPLSYVACAETAQASPECSPEEVPFGTPILLDVDDDPLTGVAGKDVAILLALAADEDALPPLAPPAPDPGALEPVRALEERLSVPRYGTTAAWTGDRAVVAGGTDGLAAVRVIDRHAPLGASVLPSAGGLASPLADAAAVVTSHAVYVLGGRGPLADSDAIVRYDPSLDVATPLAQRLPRPTSCAAVAFDGRYAYLLGGHSGGVLLDAVVRFDTETLEAIPLPARLPAPTSCASAAWTGSAVLVFGGERAAGPTDAIVRFDPATGNVGQLGTKLPTPRSGTAAAWTGDQALVIGGFDGGFLDEILAFDPRIPAAVALPLSLPTARAFASAAWDGAHAFVYGGFDGLAPLDEIVRVTPPAAPAMDAAPADAAVAAALATQARVTVKLRVERLADVSSFLASPPLPARALVAFSPVVPNATAIAALPPASIADPAKLPGMSRLVVLAVDGLATRLPRVADATITVDVGAFSGGRARADAELAVEDPPDSLAFAVTLGDRAGERALASPVSVTLALTPVPDLRFALDAARDGTRASTSLESSIPARADAYVHVARTFPTRERLDAIATIETLPQRVAIAFARSAASARFSYAATDEISRISVALDAASAEGAPNESRVRANATVLGVPREIEVALATDSGRGSISYAADDALDGLEVTVDAKGPTRDAAFAASATGVPRAVDAVWDASVPNLTRAVYAASAPTPRVGVTAEDRVAGRTLAATWTGAPAGLAFDADFRSTEKRVAWTASGPLSRADVSYTGPTATLARARVDLHAQGVPASWTASFADARVAFDAAAPLSFLDLEAADFDDRGLDSACEVVAAAVPWGADYACALLDARAQRNRLDLSIAGLAALAVANESGAASARIETAGGRPFLAAVQADARDGKRAVLRAAVDALPASLDVHAGEAFTLNASANFDLALEAALGPPSAIAAVPAFEAPLEGVAVRDGKDARGDRGVAAKVRLTGLPLYCIVDPRSGSLRFESWRPASAELRVDVLLSEGIEEKPASWGLASRTLGYPRYRGHAIPLEDAIYLFGATRPAPFPGAPPEIGREVQRFWPRNGTVENLGLVLSRPVVNGAAAALDGRIYVIGGRDDSVGADLRSVIEYDPAKGLGVERTARLPTARTEHTAAAAGGSIYVFGGQQRVPGSPPIYLSEIVQYTPATDEVRVMQARLPAGLRNMEAISDGEDIFILGGWKDGSGNQDTIFEYDPVADRLLELESKLPTPRSSFAAAFNGQSIYLLGGVGTIPGTSTVGPLDDVVEFNPESRLAIRIGRLDAPRYLLPGAAHTGDLYLVGGYRGSGNRMDVETNDILRWFPPQQRGPIEMDFSSQLNQVGVEMELQASFSAREGSVRTAGVNLTNSAELGRSTVEFAKGTSRFRLEVARVPRELGLRIEISRSRTTLGYAASDSLSSVVLQYTKGAVPVSTYDATIQLTDVPPRVNLTTGTSDFGATLDYRASASTLDFDVRVLPSLFDGDARASLHARGEDVGAETRVRVSPSELRSFTRPRTSTSDPCDEETVTELRPRILATSLPPTRSLELEARGKLEKVFLPRGHAFLTCLPTATSGVTAALRGEYLFELSGVATGFRVIAEDLGAAVISPGWATRVEGQFSRLTFDPASVTGTATLRAETLIDVCFEAGFIPRVCGTIPPLHPPLLLPLAAQTGPLVLYKGFVAPEAATFAFACDAAIGLRLTLDVGIVPDPVPDMGATTLVGNGGSGNEVTWFVVPMPTVSLSGPGEGPVAFAVATGVMIATSAAEERGSLLPRVEGCAS